jgi:hypothetical protein
MLENRFVDSKGQHTMSRAGGNNAEIMNLKENGSNAMDLRNPSVTS